MALPTNTFTNGTVANATEVNQNFSDVSTFRIGGGTITLSTDQTTYDVDYADVNIAAGDLAATDFLVIEVMGENKSTGDGMVVKLETKNTATDKTLHEFTVSTANDWFHIRETLSQDPGDSTTVFAHYVRTISGTITASANQATLGDTNILTTAFDIRINLKYDGTVGAEDSHVAYNVYAIKGV